MKAWAESHGGITYPLLSDFYPHGQIAKKFGVLRPDGTSERATFIIDKEGKIKYTTVHPIDLQPDVEELFKVLESLEPNRNLTQPKNDEDMPPKAPFEVILYCTPYCPSCRRARNFLSQHSIKYIEIDISRDREAAKRVRGWANGNETVPTFDIGGHIIVDYDEQKLIETLGIKR